MSDLVLVESRGGVARLTLNRPDAANAIDVPMADAILHATLQVAEDDAVSAVVLTGAGRLFCAGGDIKAFGADVAQANAVIARITAPLHAGILVLARMGKPLVTLVNGPAAGAGLGLALLGDVVVASRRAHFTSAYTAIGMSPDAATSWLLPRAIGLRRAQEMILTNRRVTAAEACDWGMITAVAEPEELEDELSLWLDRLSGVPVSGLAASRRLLLDSGSRGIADHLDREAASITSLAAGETGKSCISAFLDK